MSFFERMMRLQHSKLPQQHTQDSEDLPDFSLVAQVPPEDSDEEIPDEPSITRPYCQPRPKLMGGKGSVRAEMLEDMLGKKRAFEGRLRKSEKRGWELEKRVEESSCRFTMGASRHAPSHMQQSVQPVAEASTAEELNREVMMRLLGLLEAERGERSGLMEMSMRVGLEQRRDNVAPSNLQVEKECPIVINNILKSPVDTLNKDLFQKEMQLKVLELERARIQSSHKQELSKHRAASILTQQLPTPLKQENPTPLTPPHISPQSQQSTTPLTQTHQPHVTSLEQCFQEESTKHESQEQSRLKTAQKQESRVPRRREFNHKNTDRKEKPPVQRHELVTNSEQAEIQLSSKAAVRMDIPVGEGHSDITLAEAFKRKIGRLKSERVKDTSKSPSKSKPKPRPPSSRASVKQEADQAVSNTSQRQQYESTPSLKPPRKQSAKSQKSDNAQVREPPAQLVNRLIYGERAQVSKKEMYALTRKNYENLPEVVARRKNQEKQRKEAERLAKAREYYRAARTGPSAMPK